ncbi:MAG TPA: B12-binding domain-containing radical SAM protein [Candidatus Enterocloster faecavium]|mgnify:CR=1 FL=1|uniref:B12-binding domain-containing radical SAM protein n=1 Tax=Candidatus Enterocloster faecavium TaxID=2838560 RepID=A0A9D2L6F3_9FIRM|nr:B12-binding domain-containing radical SAM protein [Candidatus Enterocloster faecavium]
MNILLGAVNAKYIHSNPAVYSLRAYAIETGRCKKEEIQVAEYTINQRLEDIRRDLFRRSPQFVGFSCYIWNISVIRSLIPDLARILPGVPIWLGGPEVSFDCQELLRSVPQVKGVMRGEGEETFASLVQLYQETEGRPSDYELSAIAGLSFRGDKGRIVETPDREPLEMDRIPFYYKGIPSEQIEHRIVYYESSRGCPFSCAYCLSSVEKGLRFRSVSRVLEELDYFLEQRVPQVKFIDRTFNCRKSHAMAIWRHILEKDRGITNFHFEIAADLLDGEELELLKQMRPGLVQLEIGVQSTNPETLKAIHRPADLEKIRWTTEQIDEGKNIHQHLDLIAGLPFEDFASFQNSFNQVYAMKPEQLQLGFLKVLKGSPMEAMAKEYGIVSSPNPPYEVLFTPWLSYGELLSLKGVEEMVEVYYNSRQFVTAVGRLEGEFASPYDMFAALAGYYEQEGLDQLSHSRMARFEILWNFISSLGLGKEAMEEYRDALMTDLYLRENAKSRPSFARDPSDIREQTGRLLKGHQEDPSVLKEYRQMDSSRRNRLFHLEEMGDGSFLLFDYRDRDPLSYNAMFWKIQIEEDEK